MTLVPHVLTPWSLDAAPAVLHAAYHGAVGTCPGDDVIAVAVAHLQVEHGASLRAVWCNNAGNIDEDWFDRQAGIFPEFTTVPECEGPVCSVRAVHRRRAFATPDDGAAYYWQSMRERFPDAFYAMADPVAFVDALHSARYFTGNPAAYTHDVCDRAAAAMRRIRVAE